jgi:hypothetical protein
VSSELGEGWSGTERHVLFPAPFVPSSAIHSPRETPRLTRLTATVPHACAGRIRNRDAHCSRALAHKDRAPSNSGRAVLVLARPSAPLRHHRARSGRGPRTKWTRRVPHPVLIGHAASLSGITELAVDAAQASIARQQGRAQRATGRHRAPRPPPPPRTKRTRRVPHPVLIGHAASFIPY